MSSQEEFQYHRAVVDLLEKIERHLAPAPVERSTDPNCGPYTHHWNFGFCHTCNKPGRDQGDATAPEKAAKVSAFPVGNCVVCGELVAPYNKHAKYEGGHTCQRPQPAPPEPAQEEPECPECHHVTYHDSDCSLAPEPAQEEPWLGDQIQSAIAENATLPETLRIKPAPPEPEKKCPNCGREVARHREHIEFSDSNSAWQFTCQRPQPAPPEPAAPVEMPDEVDRACDLLEWSGNVNAAAALRDAWRNLAQPVAVGMTEELKAVLDFAADTCGMAPEEVWRESKLKEIRPLISVVRQQAAQGRKVELGKVREFFDHCSWFARDAEIFRAALAELDAADGKGEGRG